jgi:hypothetical protein
MHNAVLQLVWRDYVVTISYESPDLPRYDPRSADNSVAQEREIFFGEKSYRPSSRHRVTVRQGETEFASVLLLAGTGATGVHDHSAFIHDDKCFVAVGPYICALQLPGATLLWHTQIDQATCFGVYDAPAYASIISHGEIEVARLSYSGQVVWSASGKDTFSEEFALYDDHAEAVDFNGERYRFELEAGRSEIV